MDLQATDGYIIAGVAIDSHRFLGRMRASQLLKVAIDPRRTEDKREIEGNTQLERVRQIREAVQRAFDGAKARNVESYAQYIVRVHNGEKGMAPAIILYAENSLPVKEEPAGPGVIQIPFDIELVAIDGETQLAARFEAANIKEATKHEFVPVMICHGLDNQWARQVFHDLNSLGVKPNAALTLSMDERDPLTQVAREVAGKVAFFKDRVNFKRRQLGGRDKEVMTFAALRGACVTLAEGMGGVKHGAKPVTLPMERVPAIEVAAFEWFDAVTKVIGPAMENRAQTLAGASSVMAAIGAMGHSLVDVSNPAERAKACKKLVDQLRAVRWEKGKSWEGIAGKFGVKGKFSTSGAKDAAYAIYSALSDESSSAYGRIRENQSAITTVPNTSEDGPYSPHQDELEPVLAVTEGR